MHFQFLASTLALLVSSSSVPSAGVHARPVNERRQSTNFTTTGIITSVPDAFLPNGTNTANANASISCYQGQYIDSGNFTLAIQQACNQIGTISSMVPGQKYWQTMTSFESKPGNSSTNQTLVFAAEDPNHGQPAKIDMFVLNNSTSGGTSGNTSFHPDICMSIAEMVIQNCKDQAGNQPGGVFKDGPFTMYLDSGVP